MLSLPNHFGRLPGQQSVAELLIMNRVGALDISDIQIIGLPGFCLKLAALANELPMSRRIEFAVRWMERRLAQNATC